MEMSTVSVAAAWLINEIWTVRANIGMIIDGDLQQENQSAHTVNPGGLFGVGLEYRAVIGHGNVPFVDLSLSVGTSWTETEAPVTNVKTSYNAVDARLGARAGWAVNGNLFPYVAARLFGGPVNWEINGEEVVGSDIHHYQLAVGSAIQLGDIALYGEWAALGEQGLSAGISTAW